MACNEETTTSAAPHTSLTDALQGLTVIGVRDRLRQEALCDVLMQTACEEATPLVRLLPTAAAAERCRLRLADAGERFIGATVTTPDRWIADRWSLFGDGRVIISAPQRRSLVLDTLDAYTGDILPATSSGMVPCLEGIVADGAGAAAFEDADISDPGLSPAQRDLLVLARHYRERCDEAGLIEAGSAAAELPEIMGTAGWAPLVVEDVPRLSDAQTALLAAAAGHCGVTVVCRLDDNPASALAHAFVARLEAACRATGIPVCRLDGADILAPDAIPSPWDAPELAQLADHLFRAGEEGAVKATGAVRFCLPAGRYVEPALVAQTIEDLVARGIAPREIAVSCPDPLAWATKLAGRLETAAPRGISCRAAGTVAVAETEAGRAVNALTELVTAETHAAVARPDLRPVASDLARDPLSGLSTASALKLDAQWRGQRACGASDFLRDLCDADPDGPLAEAIPALRAGDSLAAVDALEQHLSGIPGGWLTLQHSVFDALRSVITARTALTGSPCGPRELMRLTEGLCVSAQRIWTAPSDLAAQQDAHAFAADPNAVAVVTLADAALGSYRALIMCDLTADDYSVGNRSDTRDALWEQLGLTPRPEPLDMLRWQARAALEATRSVLILERPLVDEDAEALRPATLFEEIVDCYRDDPSDLDGLDRTTGLPRDGCLPYTTAGEERFAELAGPIPYDLPSVGIAPASLTPTKEAVRTAIAHAHGVFSPSSLEMALRCPLRWLYERRLPYDTLDAGFGPIEMGSFAHDVLNRFHRLLPETGLVRITAETPPESWSGLLDECFDEALAQQDKAADPLIPVNELERRSVEALRRDLHACVARDALVPDSYVPLLHEWTFGMAGSETAAVPYAGLLLCGTIDRIDAAPDGSALVIDYKGSLGTGYQPARPAAGQQDDDPTYALHHLPLHSQILMYAGILHRVLPDLVPVGAVYGSYRTGTAAGFIDAKEPSLCSELDLDVRCLLPDDPQGGGSLACLLDNVEDEVAAAMERLQAGDAAPDPRFGKDSCANCSLANVCPKRVS